MLDFIDKIEREERSLILKIKYRFKGYPHLVADEKGTFYMLAHCPNKRTIPQKKLNSSSGYIYYHGYKKYISELRKKVIKC